MSTYAGNTNQQIKRFGAQLLFAALFALAMAAGFSLWNLPRAEAGAKAPQTFYGPAREIGAGSARSYVTMSDGQPIEIGIELEEDALRDLPAPDPKSHHHVVAGMHLDMSEYLLELPDQAKSTPFNFLELDWNPAGHEPAGIYDKPHFDFHFYTITQAERDAIDPSDPEYARKAARFPRPEFVPASYMTPPPITPVPKMGLHWVSTAADELHGKPFTQSFIYGSWNGRVAFLEPMITKAFLDSKPDLTLPIAAAQCYEPAGLYPATYSIRYDQASGKYRIALKDFTSRDCKLPDTRVAEIPEPAHGNK